MSEASKFPQIFVLTPRPGHGYDCDGPHSTESDLIKTYQILNRLMNYPGQFLKLTLEEPDRFGTVFPRVDDVTDEAHAAGKAPPLPGLS